MIELDGRDHTFERSDGRTIAYLDLGDPGGRVVVSNHGGLSSRLDVLPAHDAAAAAGVRLLSPDRPGIGGSTRLPGRTLLDWPDDVAALLDHVGAERTALMGWSMGGPYAAACAHVLGDRAAALALVASPIPADWDDEGDHLNRMDRTLLALSGAAAPIDRVIFHLMHAAAHRAPKAFAKQSGATGDLAEELPAAVAEGLADPKGVVDDYRVFGAPWGFDPGDLALPVHLWQGDADELVPPAWAERLAAAIPGATVTAVAGASHFLWYDHWTEIFDGLLETDW
jgi:pimeloyl-ACP methyl ester carboxylesterase